MQGRPGGAIALANWTPDGFIGRLFRTISRRVLPLPGVRPPVEWGSEDRLRELFAFDTATDGTLEVPSAYVQVLAYRA